MRRILVYGMTENSGGIEAYLMNYFINLDRSKIIFDFVTDCPVMAYEKEAVSLGSKIFYIPSRRENIIRHMMSIRKIVSENGYDTVYYNILSASAVFSMFGLFGKKGIKIITHSHNNSVGNLRVHLILRPLLNFMTDKRLACSKGAAKFMFGEKYAKSATVINNAVDTERFKFDQFVRNEVRKEFHIENRLVIGHIGRLCYQKNTLFLIDVFNEILKHNRNAVLLLVGDGEDKDAVLNKIKNLGLGKCVIMTGVRSDVHRILQAMDLLLLPSRFEGLPVVLIEAQSSGLRCLTSSAVTKAAKVTELVQYINLNASASFWAKRALQCARYERADTSEEIKNAGFDIKAQAAHLQDVFL
ncbi:MAG: glycosyltransferase family 1 protein [Oscillospiraceae bacterium]|nr:glycosyltransferase family 1 protein [Oscillospiraceae bacterium]